jgi:hypothetical protein
VAADTNEMGVSELADFVIEGVLDVLRAEEVEAIDANSSAGMPIDSWSAGLSISIGTGSV